MNIRYARTTSAPYLSTCSSGSLTEAARSDRIEQFGEQEER